MSKVVIDREDAQLALSCLIERANQLNKSKELNGLSPVQNHHIDQLNDRIKNLHKTLSQPDGWQLVPKEPTDAMSKAAYVSVRPLHSDGTFKSYTQLTAETYKAMLAAAPRPGGDDA